MKTSLLHRLLSFVTLISASLAQADTTAPGYIAFTQGHVVPACRTVAHVEDGTGTTRYFRIPDTNNDSDISSILLTSVAAKLKVDITYDPQVTTGCGNEPAINYITIYPN